MRSPGLVVALAAAVGGALIYLVSLPALWRLSWLDGVVFAGLGAAQLATAAAVLARPPRRPSPDELVATVTDFLLATLR